jgi:hypothetical protein
VHGRKLVAAGVALMVLLAACSAAAKKKAAVRAEAPTTTDAPSSSTTAPPVAPLTGLPQPDPARRARPALIVKIDNVAGARPQAGITKADVVFEEEVEGGLTRLAAVFQSADADPVGPVRSTRTSDIDIVSLLNHPLYAFSGGNSRFVAEIDASGIVDVGYVARPHDYYFGPGSAPHNLYTRASALYASAPPGAGTPPAIFSFRPLGAAPLNASATPVTHASLDWPASSAAWTWDGASQTWRRIQDGTPDVDQGGQQVAVPNVVIQSVTYVADGVASGEGVNPPPPIPKAVLVGQGDVWVLTGGKVIKGQWSRPSAGVATQYTDATGAPIQLAPGPSWVELIPAGTIPAVS